MAVKKPFCVRGEPSSPVSGFFKTHPVAGNMKLSIQEKIGYGLGDTASNLIWATLMSFMMFYYTDVYGLAAGVVGTMFLITRFIDGCSDFLIGALADRTETRWGKFRPYLLWMCCPLACVTILTFTVPDFDPKGKLIYAWVTYNLLMVLYTAINIPYSALSGVMTDDPVDRTSLSSYRMVLAQCGGFIVNAAMLPLVAFFGKGNQATGYQMTMALFAMLAVGLFFVTFSTTRERIQPVSRQKTNVCQDLRVLLSNRHWLVLFFVGMLDLVFIILRAGTLVYYAKYVLGLEARSITTFLLLGNIGFILGALITRFAVAACGKKNTMIFAHVIMGVSAGLVFWIPSDAVSIVFALQVIHAIGGGLNAVLFFSMIADTADYSEWKHGVRSTGLIFSATTFAQKVGMGVGGAMAGFFLTRSGYIANEVQTAGSSHGIVLLVSLVPAVGFLISGGLFSRYGLTEEECETIRDEMAERRVSAG